MSTNAAQIDPAPAEPERDDSVPKGIPYIISNEFAERFCFYGINSILTLFLAQNLHFTEARANAWQSMFKMSAYFFPMLGAIVSDVFWGKFRTIFVFSIFYAVGCVALSVFGHTPNAIAASLFFVALGTGGIKPCVSTNVGDQFSAKNQHLIERAFSWFYMAINAGSSISIFACPILLANPKYGAGWAFGLPAAMMILATVAFLAGRDKYVHVPPAGRQWVADIVGKEGRALVGRLVVIYLFVAGFWMLWEQGNGNAFTLQAASPLMEKHIFNFSFLPAGVRAYAFLPAQLQVVNGLFILALVPVFSYFVYPMWGKFTKVTPLRKIGVGFFITAASFVIVARIEARIQHGETVSAWWQILAYIILTCAEILVSITALEFSYKQAPLRMKSFIMSLFLLSTSLGNLCVAMVNKAMVKPLHATAIATGPETWVSMPSAAGIVPGQKIDVTDTSDADEQGKHPAGIEVVAADGSREPLAGTFLAMKIDEGGHRVMLMNPARQPLRTDGAYRPSLEVSTYYLVGPMYYYFFMGVMCVLGVLFIFYALGYKEQTFVRG